MILLIILTVVMIIGAIYQQNVAAIGYVGILKEIKKAEGDIWVVIYALYFLDGNILFYMKNIVSVFRNSDGGSPVCFLNSLLKYSGLSYPTIDATSATEYVVVRSSVFAFVIRRFNIYCMGVTPL